MSLLKELMAESLGCYSQSEIIKAENFICDFGLPKVSLTLDKVDISNIYFTTNCDNYRDYLKIIPEVLHAEIVERYLKCVENDVSFVATELGGHLYIRHTDETDYVSVETLFYQSIEEWDVNKLTNQT